MALLNNARGDARYGGESGPTVLPDYTIAGVPAAALHKGHLIFVTDAAGVGSPVGSPLSTTAGQPAFSDGTRWISLIDGSILA